MSDNVMYDTPLEFVNDAVASNGECVAQSVIPLQDGTYRCACTCEEWEILAGSKDEGLTEARRHTGWEDPA
jgi:hypothetical protein